MGGRGGDASADPGRARPAAQRGRAHPRPRGQPAHELRFAGGEGLRPAQRPRPAVGAARGRAGRPAGRLQHADLQPQRPGLHLRQSAGHGGRRRQEPLHPDDQRRLYPGCRLQQGYGRADPDVLVEHAGRLRHRQRRPHRALRPVGRSLVPERVRPRQLAVHLRLADARSPGRVLLLSVQHPQLPRLSQVRRVARCLLRHHQREQPGHLRHEPCGHAGRRAGHLATLHRHRPGRLWFRSPHAGRHGRPDRAAGRRAWHHHAPRGHRSPQRPRLPGHRPPGGLRLFGQLDDARQLDLHQDRRHPDGRVRLDAVRPDLVLLHGHAGRCAR